MTTEGKRHFGAVVGSNDLWIKYVNEKAKEWASEFKVLPEFVKSQPQAIYAAFCFAEQNKFSSFLWIIPEMNNLMRSVDEIVQNFLLQASSVETISEKEREFYSVVWSESSVIPLFSEKAGSDLENLLAITAPVVACIIAPDTDLPNADKINETTRIITQKRSNNLSTSHQRFKRNWILIQKEQSFKQKKRVLLAG